MEEYRIIVDKEQSGERMDAYLAKYLEGYSRSYLQRCIRDACITAGEKTVKPNYRLKSEDSIEIRLPDPEPLEIRAENIPLDILYEDQDLIFVNKPKGMVVHPAPGHAEGTLVNALLYHCGPDLSGINGVMRPGIVHRIDMDTTGVLVICKNDMAHNKVAQQLAVHSITRRYTCIAHGRFDRADGTIDAPIGRSRTNRLKMAVVADGKRAVTHYHVREHLKGYTWLNCELETGRTHQIRVHLTSIHHPLLGDTVYGNLPHPFHLEGQTLHAETLGLIHPRTGKYLEISAPIPEYFNEILKKLKSDNN